jgi:hypothetical protein
MSGADAFATRISAKPVPYIPFPICPQTEPPQTNSVSRMLNPTQPNAPQDRRTSEAKLQRSFYPAISQQRSHLEFEFHCNLKLPV